MSEPKVGTGYIAGASTYEVLAGSTTPEVAIARHNETGKHDSFSDPVAIKDVNGVKTFVAVSGGVQERPKEGLLNMLGGLLPDRLVPDEFKVFEYRYVPMYQIKAA